MLPQQPFYFIRHGETDWNARGLWQGQTDVPLNETGLTQARKAALRLTGSTVSRVVSSPLSRAFHTGEIIAGALGVEIHTDPRLMERAYGSYEGLNWQEIRTRHRIAKGKSHEHILPHDAETFEQVQARMHEALGHWVSLHPGEDILFVSHGGAARTLVKEFSAPNGIPYHLRPSPAGWLVTAL